MKQNPSLQTVKNAEALSCLPQDFLQLLRCALVSALQEAALLTETQVQQVQKALSFHVDSGETE